jgi:hypothetical protein
VRLSGVATPLCADLAEARGEPLAGSAAKAGRWLLLEQPGPWGRTGLHDSALPAALAAELERRAEAHGIRVGLVRQRTAPYAPPSRACFLISCSRDGAWLRRHDLSAPEEALELPLAELGAGRVPAGGADPGPLYLVCTHGTRDPCCARRGRPLARALRAVRPGRVWEGSHVGGHRFAANLIAFPAGLCYGRVPAAAARELAERHERGRVTVPHLRGRCGDSPAAQAADALARAELGADGVDDLRPVAERAAGDGGTLVDLARPDGTRWRAHVRFAPTGDPRPTSCGGEPDDPGRVRLVGLAPVEDGVSPG